MKSMMNFVLLVDYYIEFILEVIVSLYLKINDVALLIQVRV